MGGMQATQKAIAARLGVSASLVSRALRGEAGRIGASPETIRRICEEAARCGYAPHLAALSLRGGSNRLLGVVVRDFADPFFGPMLGALQRLAAAEPACSLVMTGGGPGDQTPFGRHRLDGFILVGSDFQPPGLERLVQSGTPLVRLGEGADDEPIAHVRVAQAFGFNQLLDYLRALGHRYIAYLDNGTPASARRAALLRQGFSQAGLPAPPQAFITLPDTSPQTLSAALRRLMQDQGAERITAVVAADDVLALTVLRVLHEAGVSVPRNLSVAGVDDIPFAPLAVPALTTIRAPIAALAEQAFLLARGRQPPGPVRIDVQPELIVRESCAKPREDRA